ncbi:cytochrome c family protein [Aestuariibius sp. HNIBRBA575]|uniref:c-type cytochrome n=1 Tax=Aestuariibius sp. HNIBRBA575 TaxID=3233343 RepID=UPI0034A34BC6
MFDTMTLTKASAGIIATFLVFLLGKWAAESIYHTAGHGDHPGYVIEVAQAGGEDVVVDEGPAFEEVYASADAAAGEGQWRSCRSCHSIEEGVNGTGPSLYGVVGRQAGGVAEFSYKGTFDGIVDVWTPELLNAFLESPKGLIPDTGMSFNGMRKIEDRANLIAYLDSLDD